MFCIILKIFKLCANFEKWLSQNELFKCTAKTTQVRVVGMPIKSNMPVQDRRIVDRGTQFSKKQSARRFSIWTLVYSLTNKKSTLNKSPSIKLCMQWKFWPCLYTYMPFKIEISGCTSNHDENFHQKWHCHFHIFYQSLEISWQIMGTILENKVLKIVVCKTCAPKLIFFNEKRMERFK